MKRRKPPRRKEATPPAVVHEDLNETCGAVYGVADPRERDALAREAESIEDPLQDWPESAAEEQVRPPRNRQS